MHAGHHIGEFLFCGVQQSSQYCNNSKPFGPTFTGFSTQIFRDSRETRCCSPVNTEKNKNTALRVLDHRSSDWHKFLWSELVFSDTLQRSGPGHNFLPSLTHLTRTKYSGAPPSIHSTGNRLLQCYGTLHSTLSSTKFKSKSACSIIIYLAARNLVFGAWSGLYYSHISDQAT